MRTLALTLLCLATSVAAQQPAAHRYTRADTLRGSNGPARAWWDVEFYDLHVRVNPADSSISGWNGITYRVLRPHAEMQIDLQVPLQVDSIVQRGRRFEFRRDGNAFFVTVPATQTPGTRETIAVYYHGKPRAAQNAPWDGGFVWGRDSLGRRFIATANEGLGASVWWPNKDIASDEPDSQRVAIAVPDSLVNVSNGRLRSVRSDGKGFTTWEWFVHNPINNYNVAVNAARYAHFTRYFHGEGGLLTMDFYPLAIHEDTARVQFRQAETTLACLEHWFGPYPWYDDGFKLVETPHLGMEHQSAVAYGNHYINGYARRDSNGRYVSSDLSGTGLGLKWDFIIVHETAHEWWGNNISAKDHADMWIHESFANYSEALYTECLDGKEAGAAYTIGSRRGIRNDMPIIPAFGVNAEGSGDMYPKGGAMLHTIRALLGDDVRWRAVLRGANQRFRHQTITGAELREYISAQTGMDLSRVFQQYLETTKIPVLEYRAGNGSIAYRWAGVVPGFDMPVDVTLPGAAAGTYVRLRPSTTWASVAAPRAAARDTLAVRPDFYVRSRKTAR